MQQLTRSITFYAAACLSLLLFSGAALARELPDFTKLVEQYSAAVVNISTVQKRTMTRHPRMQQMPDIPENSPFYDFFRRFFGEVPEGTEPYQERASLGSGFIISKDGYVITNNHVVQDADEIIVRLNDRREFTAKVIGTDERSDIAVLKITGKDLPTVKLGDSSRLKVGEWVLAIGSPFGFDHSVTAGIVSAMGRSLPNENYIPFIQTDVAINPGNSGGPLFNLDGEVVGVNSQIYSRTGGFMGLSFAVPVNVVTSVYKQLKEQGHVSRGWLGVLIQDVTKELAESFGMNKPHGALVAKILPDSPAAKAGIEVGDVIIDYDGNEISFSSDLPPMVGSTTIGSSVPVKVIRHGKTKTLRVKISKLPEEEELAQAGIGGGPGGAVTPTNPLNITVADLDDDQRKELGIDKGVLVQDVQDGPASKAGMRSGDIILLLNNNKVKDVGDFNDIVKKLPNDKSIPILIQRKGNPIFLAFRLADDEGGK